MPSKLLESIKKAIVGEELPEEARSTPVKNAGKQSALAQLNGVGEKTAQALENAGIKTIKQLAKATPADLQAVEGIGEATAKKLISAAQHVAEPKKQTTQATKKTAKKNTKKKTPTKKTSKKKTPAKNTSAKKSPSKQPTKKPTKKKTPAKKKPTKKTSKKTPSKKPTKTTTPTKKPTTKEPTKPPVDWSKRELENLQTPDPRKQTWDPNRSKIKAAIENGLPLSYFSVQHILYIGAAHGYTISHIAHRPLEIYALEKSKEMMRHFLPLAENLPSVLPILGDAAYPESYAHYMPERMDIVFQDIAQRDQTGLFIRNCERFLSRHGVGMLCMKALAVDSTAEPAAIFAETRERLEAEGLTIVQEISLEPYQKGHRLFVVHQNPYGDF